MVGEIIFTVVVCLGGFPYRALTGLVLYFKVIIMNHNKVLKIIIISTSCCAHMGYKIDLRQYRDIGGTRGVGSDMVNNRSVIILWSH